MTPDRSSPLEMQGAGVRHGWTPLLDAMPQGVMLVDAGGRYLEVNLAATEILGLDRETLLSFSLPEPWSRLSAADGTVLAVEEFPGLDALRTGTPVRRKTLGWNREDGSTTWLAMSAEPLKGGGALVSFDLLNEHPLQSSKLERQGQHDVTDRKEAENALHQEKTFTRALMDNQIEGVVACDEHGELVLFNRTLARWQGMDALKLPKEQWAGHYDLFEADGETPLATHAIPLVRAFNGEVLHDVGLVICAKDQPPRHVLCSGSPILDETNRKLGAVVVMHDITQQRKNAELLRNTLQRQELATASASMGVWDWDLQSGSMTWDQRMFELYGATHGEIQGTVQDWKDGLHSEDLERAMAECEAAIRGEAPFDTEFRVKHRNGTILWIKANAVVVRDQHGDPVRMIGINQDITEAKQAIEKVKLFEVSINSSTDGAYWMNNEGRFIYVNPTACKMLGYSEDELLQMSLFDVAPNRNINNWVETVDYLRINRHYFSETVHRRKDGSEFPVEISTTMISVNDIEYINGFARDITGRKKAEEILQSQTALLEAQMNATIDGILVVSEQGKRRLINARLIELFDVPRDIIADEDDASLLDHVVKRTINPEGFLEQVNYLYSHLNETSRDEIEFTDGMILDRYSAPVLGDDGKYFGRIWTFRDISERKKAEKALRESEERYRNQFDMAGEGIFTLSTEGEFLEANGAFARMHGYTVKEMLDMKLKDFVTAEILTGVGNDRLRQISEGKSLIFETEHIHKDGHIFPVEVSACQVSTGGKKMILGFHRDITERKSLESALERKIIALTRPMGDIGQLAFEELFNLGEIQKIQDALAQATGVASIITRPDGTPITRPSNFTYLCSEIIRKTEKGRMNCFKSDAAVGSYHPAGPIVQQCFTCGLWDAGTSISVGGYHVANWLIGQVRDESQSLENMAAYAKEIGADEGLFLEAFKDVPSMPRERLNQIAESLFVLAGRLSDSAYQNVQQARFISDKNAAEAEVRSLNQTLEQRVKERTAQFEAANRELEAFSYSVSHDLRAPLRSIDGFSQVLLEDYQDKLDEDGKHHLFRIRSGTQRMGHLIDDLLKLSKTSRSELTVSACDLSALSSRVAGDLADRNPERRVAIFIHPGMLVQADNHLMQVVLENLLGNAWKFTSKREAPSIEVGETVSPQGDRAFFIRDNGAGFDMAHADKLFCAFQRLHAVTDFDGTGIGLAIVQRIIHRHGGRVWAEARPGEGATFFFTLLDRAML